MFISPTVVGDKLIVGSCAGSLYALDRATGKPVWLHDTKADGPSAQFHGEPLLLDSTLIVPTDADGTTHLYAFDVTSGEVQWKLPFANGIATTPLRAGGRVVAVTREGEVVAVEAKSGKVLWRVSPAGALKVLPFVQSPALVSHRVLFADNTGRIFALDAATGRILWSKSLAARANTSLVPFAGAVIVGTADGYLNWIAPGSGKITKRVRLDATPYGTPMPSGSLLLVLAQGGKGKLLTVDATGAIRWRQETATEWTTFRPLLSGSLVVVGNEAKELCAFDRTTGMLRWCNPVGKVPRGLGISEDGVLYVGSLSGVVQAYRVTPPRRP